MTTNNSVFQSLLDIVELRGAVFCLLIDPDRSDAAQFVSLAQEAESCGVDCILVGTSFSLSSTFSSSVQQIKGVTPLPVVIFPGSYAQITPHADAILFSSLISGRNANYLIDEQVKGAPIVRQCQLEPIPTGYMLIESGPLTSVQYVSGTMPIPRTKNDIAAAHALAAQYLGMKLVYLEAGSGARDAVAPEMVEAVSTYVDIPVMVGGGIRTPEQCAERVEAGASFVVVGHQLETGTDLSLLRQLTAATHNREKVTV